MSYASDLGANIHEFLPYNTYFVDNDHDVWSGALFDGRLSPTEHALQEVYARALERNGAFCLVFRDEAMIHLFLAGTDEDDAPMRRFVGQARKHHGKMVLTLDELSEILGTDLSGRVLQNYTWHATLNLTAIPRHMRQRSFELSFCADGMWGLADWEHSQNYRFKFNRLILELHCRMELMLGRSQNRWHGAPVRFGYDGEHLFSDADCNARSTVVVVSDSLDEPLVVSGYVALMSVDKKDFTDDGLLYELPEPQPLQDLSARRRGGERAVDRTMPQDVLMANMAA